MKKAITYFTRCFEGHNADSNICKEEEHTVYVEDIPPVQNGNIYYFIKNDFEYFVLIKINGRWYK